MKVIEKLALDLVEKATHPEGDPRLRRAMKAAYEAGFRAAREMAAKECDQEYEDDQWSAWEKMAQNIRQLGEEEVQG